MSIFCFGLSHRTAPVDVRERFAISVSALPEAYVQRYFAPGDTNVFTGPVWSSGVFIAVLSAEKAADMLDRVLRRPEHRALEFRRYERHLGRVMNLYLNLVNSWYTQEFAEVFFNPQEFLQLISAVNSLLAGSEKPLPEVRWRMWVFNLLVFLQKRFAIIAPRMSLQPNSR